MVGEVRQYEYPSNFGLVTYLILDEILHEHDNDEDSYELKVLIMTYDNMESELWRPGSIVYADRDSNFYAKSTKLF